MNESVAELGRELFLVKAGLLEAQMAREECDAHKERLRESAAGVLAELRVARERIAVLEAHVRRVERENEALSERLPGEIERSAAAREALLRAQEELVAAHAAGNESESLVDALQLQVLELGTELARARGLAPSSG